MSIACKRGPAKVEANLTPLIDVTFLLIVFFVLVSQIVELENVDLDLPAPTDPVSELAGDEQRAVVNIVPKPDGDILEYRLGGRSYAADRDGLQAMTARLTSMYRNNPGLSVNLRADASTHYRWVEPVMQAVSTAALLSEREMAVARVNLVVVRED
ncbi:MAG: biopolymer transporter ExbD [Phycisphaerales bacterium]